MSLFFVLYQSNNISTYFCHVHIFVMYIVISIPSTLYIFMPNTYFIPSTSLCQEHIYVKCIFIPSTLSCQAHCRYSFQVHLSYKVHLHTKYISIPSTSLYQVHLCVMYIFIPSTPSSQVHIQAKCISMAQVVFIMLQGVRVRALLTITFNALRWLQHIAPTLFCERFLVSSDSTKRDFMLCHVVNCYSNIMCFQKYIKEEKFD